MRPNRLRVGAVDHPFSKSMPVASTVSASPHWPNYLPHHLVKPYTTLAANLEVSALRYGDRTAIGFMGRDISYTELLQASRHFAGWLQSMGVERGDRVMLYMQNAPQWIMAYYGVLRADAVLVPANPMNKADELKKLLQDSGAKVIVCSAELAATASQASEGTSVTHLVSAAYSDYLPDAPVVALPEWMHTEWPLPPGAIAWPDTLAAHLDPAPPMAQPGDLATINYTSGSTGVAKGCMHTHQTIMHTAVGLATWHGHAPGTAFLGVAPMYQVAGFTVAANCAIYVGGTVVPLPRWDRRLAMGLIQHYRVHFGGVAPTALIDMLSDPEIDRYDLSSLKRVSFGGATMPDSVWKQVNEKLGLQFIEAYGMTEAAATTHINPVHRPKRQCLGIPFFDTQSIVVNAETLEPCLAGEPGEILIAGPQLFLGYWNKPEETAESFVEIDGTRYFRSGDIGMVDDEGYFFMTDRVKRMINASGFKVWPAEVENLLYAHPAIKEACVIGTHDSYRGESVKALVVLKPGFEGKVSAQDVIDWSRERMAAYKYPRSVEFLDALPKSPVGKILWRDLQDAEATKSSTTKTPA
jgi:fatty-acyl-CoA synthase